MIMISGFMIFVYILILGVFIAIAFAEAILVKRNKKKTAIALILIVFALMTLNSISLSTVTTYMSNANVSIISIESNNKDIGELEIVCDEDNKVLGFGMLKLNAGGTPEYLKLEYDNGKLIGEEEALEYSDDLYESLRGTPWKKLTGESMNADQLDELSNQVETSFEAENFVKTFLISNITTAILIAINIIFTYRNKRQKMKNVDKIKIQDL